VAGQSGTGREYLSWQEVLEMAKAGITFGSHTVTHPFLSRMPLSEVKDEIITSKETIEGRLGSPVRILAYPSGGQADFNESIKRVLKDAGFLCAVTTLWGTNSFSTDPYELRRVQAWDPNPQMFALRLGYYRLFS
jgi:peptidoglycan/xylan/chitin deacetylase (PgdA/CDA1 family)